MNIAKLLLNLNPINIQFYEMQVHILRDQNLTGSNVSHAHLSLLYHICALNKSWN